MGSVFSGGKGKYINNLGSMNSEQAAAHNKRMSKALENIGPWGGGTYSFAIPDKNAGPGYDGGYKPSGDNDAGSGNPWYHDRQIAVDRASRASQVSADNAQAGAARRAAEMGRDHKVTDDFLVGSSAQQASNMNQAGFGVDKENVGIHNQFAMADKQNAQQNERFYANLNMQQEQNQAQLQMQQQQMDFSQQQVRDQNKMQSAQAKEASKQAKTMFEENENKLAENKKQEASKAQAAAKQAKQAQAQAKKDAYNKRLANNYKNATQEQRDAYIKKRNFMDQFGR